MFKAFACELPTQLQSRFSRYIDVHNTRSTNSLVVLQSRTNLKAMCLSIHGVKLWNYLPLTLKISNSILVFKKQLKQY